MGHPAADRYDLVADRQGAGPLWQPLGGAGGPKKLPGDWRSAVIRTGEDDSSFTVVFQRSGIESVVPADKSVFAVARENGVSVLGSCLEGICGTCETEVLEGDIDHRDSVLDDDEKEANEVMMVCVSRCRGPRLVLDL